MAKTTVKYNCGHSIEKDLPAHDFKPNASGKTFLQRAAGMDCKDCRAKARGKAAPKAAADKAKREKAAKAKKAKAEKAKKAKEKKAAAAAK